ncbi:MAG: hypothetical protein AAGB22_14680 [Bacteroidota bacterium]
MDTWPYLLILPVLAGILVQDLRFRAISWYWLPLLFGALLFQAFTHRNTELIVSDFMTNLVFIGIQLVVITLYFSVKEGRLTWVVNRFIGSGDLLFLVALSIGFAPFNFVLFTLLALVFSLLAFPVMMAVQRKRPATIPLAGLMSVPLMAGAVLMALNGPLNVFYEDWWYPWIM